MRNILIYFAIKYKGDYKKIYNAIRVKEQVSDEDLMKVKSMNIKAVTCIDDNYPNQLKEAFCPPFVLFYDGDINLLSDEYTRLAVIGSRKPSQYGINATRKILKDALNIKPFVTISGLATGIDSIAHFVSLDLGQKTIAVLGNGVNVAYPQVNKKLYEEIRKNGLLISEYPPDLEPSKENFPNRNRIIAALCSGILVGNALNKSGTQITVKYGLENNKDIYAIPHSIFEESFCNHLIYEGAISIMSGKCLIDELF